MDRIPPVDVVSPTDGRPPFRELGGPSLLELFGLKLVEEPPGLQLGARRGPDPRSIVLEARMDYTIRERGPDGRWRTR